MEVFDLTLNKTMGSKSIHGTHFIALIFLEFCVLYAVDRTLMPVFGLILHQYGPVAANS